MSTIRRLLISLLTVGATLVCLLELQRLVIRDPALRLINGLAIVVGALFFVFLTIRCAIFMTLARLKKIAPQLQGGVKNLGKMMTLAIMSFAGCAFILSVAFGDRRYSVSGLYWPLGISTALAVIGISCSSYAYRDIRAWILYRRHHGKKT